MTIADHIRELARDSSVPGDLYEQFAKIADELDAKANEIVNAMDERDISEAADRLLDVAQSIGGPIQNTTQEDDGFLGWTDEEIAAYRRDNPKIVTTQYLGADRE